MTNELSSYSLGSVTHTNTRAAWWKVTLPETSYISNVDLYNRMDCCQQYIQGSKVQIDDTQIGTVQVVVGQQLYRFQADMTGKEMTNLTNKKEYKPYVESIYFFILRIQSMQDS